MEVEELDQLKEFMEAAKMDVCKGEYHIPLDHRLTHPNYPQLGPPSKISQELYYEILTKVLSDLRQLVTAETENFYQSGNTEMTTEDRDAILGSVDGQKVRLKVLQEFNIIGKHFL